MIIKIFINLWKCYLSVLSQIYINHIYGLVYILICTFYPNASNRADFLQKNICYFPEFWFYMYMYISCIIRSNLCFCTLPNILYQRCRNLWWGKVLQYANKYNKTTKTLNCQVQSNLIYIGVQPNWSLFTFKTYLACMYLDHD